MRLCREAGCAGPQSRWYRDDTCLARDLGVGREWGCKLSLCPLWVISRRLVAPSQMSAFGGKADVNHCVGECPLLAKSGHSLLTLDDLRL